MHIPITLPPNNVLTHHMLVQAGACSEQRKMFVETFGYKVKLNSDNLRKAYDAGLYLLWFGEHFCHDLDAWYKDSTEWCNIPSTREGGTVDDLFDLVLKHCTTQKLR